MRRSQIIGVGSYLPEIILSNTDLAERHGVETSDDWIRERTGITERRFVSPGQLTSDLAIEASKAALQNAELEADALDLIVLATATPDQTFPATAAKVQAALGCRPGIPVFDMQAVCSGFVYATATADNFIRVGQADRVLVIGAETFSNILDFEDRTTSVLFGDGAGAMVLQAGEGTGGSDDTGILHTVLHADGRHHDLLYVDGGPATTRNAGHLRMQGREVFRHAVTNLHGVMLEVLEGAGLGAEAVDWIVPHQANRRILEATAKKLGLGMEKVVSTVDRHANTSAASVPLALDEAIRDGRIQKGQLILLEAMGGGFTWGAALVRL
ncbi:MAG: beta-ketoacyl-ACP synthase III [Rhodospirillaceae bacterium]